MNTILQMYRKQAHLKKILIMYNFYKIMNSIYFILISVLRDIWRPGGGSIKKTQMKQHLKRCFVCVL